MTAPRISPSVMSPDQIATLIQMAAAGAKYPAIAAELGISYHKVRRMGHRIAKGDAEALLGNRAPRRKGVNTAAMRSNAAFVARMKAAIARRDEKVSIGVVVEPVDHYMRLRRAGGDSGYRSSAAMAAERGE